MDALLTMWGYNLPRNPMLPLSAIPRTHYTLDTISHPNISSDKDLCRIDMNMCASVWV